MRTLEDDFIFGEFYKYNDIPSGGRRRKKIPQMFGLIFNLHCETTQS